jgi:radical SAM superfamily enzyme YgiQ (UPF0313 family)
MKVILINSPLFREFNSLYDEDSLPPLGLGYIATKLQDRNIDVELIDAIHQRIPLNDLIASINYLKPTFIGINIFTTNYTLVKELIESINYKTQIIVGGLSTKELYKSIVEWETENNIDIVIGDGELIVPDIVNNCLKDKPYFEKNNRRVFKVDINSCYVNHDISPLLLNRKFFLNEPTNHPLGFYEANIVTSRGCIYNCTFCAAARGLNTEFPIRERSIESICAELNNIKEKYPNVTSIRVLDDLFLKTSKTISKAIEIFSQFDFSWRAMAHVMTFKNVDMDELIALKKSGCNELFIGIESGSPKILKSINKTNNISIIEENLEKVLKAGINIKGYFIYGFPNETKEDMEMTYSLAQNLKKFSIKYGSFFRTSVFQYRPYHATQIYHDLKEKGVDINVNNVEGNKALSDLVGRQQFNFHNGNFSEVESKEVHDYIYRTTNLNESEIFPQLKSTIRAK